jgi:DinB superfamily
MEHLQYPIGRFNKEKKHSFSEVKESIAYLKDFPALLKIATIGLSDSQLSKTYRPNGWNIRQLVHHIADSHANMYIRLKCALTENNPTIKGYDEALWAEMSDSQLPILSSIGIIEGLHGRFSCILETLEDADFDKTYYHPGYAATYLLRNVIALYTWHSKHHLAHIYLALGNE